MNSGEVLEILTSWEDEELEQLISELNINGVVSDEDKTGISSNMIEGWDESCDTYLSKKGYTGGTLSKCAKFFTEHGAIYALFDSAKLEYSSALSYLAEVNKRSLI